MSNLKVSEVSTKDGRDRKVLKVVPQDSTHDCHPKGLRAGAKYYSVRDNGQVKKVFKVLRVVLEVPECLDSTRSRRPPSKRSKVR